MALIKICQDLICKRQLWILFVEVVSLQLAASGRFELKLLLNSVWAKTFINLALEFPPIFVAQKQFRFVLLMELKAIITSEFTQLLLWMKFRPQCPNMCLLRSALLALGLKLAQLCDVVRAHCRHHGKGLAHSVHSTEQAYRRIACLP